MKALKQRGPQIGRKTDVGRVRTANEDSMGDIPVEDGHVLIVADGMGGYRGGAIASSLVVEAIEEYFHDTKLSDPQKALRESIYTANERIYLRGKQDEDLSRMGSTCVLALVKGNQLHLAHVGDSRIYFMRKGGKLQRLTRDHTVVQHFVDVGLLSEEEAEGHPDSHILSRALGPRAHVEPEVSDDPVVLKEGDRVLLCSDGLTKMLTEQNISTMLAMDTPLQSIAEKMVDVANHNGGEDNVTVLAYEYHKGEGDDDSEAAVETKLNVKDDVDEDADADTLDPTGPSISAELPGPPEAAEEESSKSEAPQADESQDESEPEAETPAEEASTESNEVPTSTEEEPS